MSSLWLVMVVQKNVKVSVSVIPENLEQDIDLIFADGMVGAIPAFESKEAADKYANGREVIEAVMQ
jgi:hypothetical protein